MRREKNGKCVQKYPKNSNLKLLDHILAKSADNTHASTQF